MIETLEAYWSRELDALVEIVTRGWTERPTDYALYVDGTYMVSYKNLEEIEMYLETYFMKAAL